MEEAYSISLIGNQLKLTSLTGIGFDGRDSIYLENILGFEESDDGHLILISSLDEISKVSADVLEYFKSKNRTIQVEGELNELITKQEGKERELEVSIEQGAKLKKHPQKTIVVPDFERTLKPYQVPAVAHMIGIGNSANFSVPGSGKTTITLAAYSILKNRKVVDKVMIVAPRAAFMSWEDEFKGCFGRVPISVRISGPIQERKKLHNDADQADLIMMSYQMVTKDQEWVAKFLTSNRVLLILDESHYIKRLQGGAWSTTLISLAPLATRRIILTGTPVPNSLEDLWSQMNFLWPNTDILGTSDSYKDRINNDSNARDSIREELRPLYWRIPKSKLKLKSPKIHRIPVKMKPVQQAIYDAIAIKVLSEIERAPVERQRLRNWRRARTIRLLQTASNPSLLARISNEFEIPPMDSTGLSVTELIENYPDYETPPKLEVALKLTKEMLLKGEKVLIWTSFVHNIKTLENLLSEFKPRLVYGEIPKDDNEDEFFNREQMIRDFKETKEFNLLIANPSACAESVSLHKICHHAIYVDRTFNCAQFTQSLDRIHRIGLDPNEQVHYYFLMSKDSIDDVIDDRLKEKQKQMFEILEDELALINLESSIGDMSEPNEEELDFNRVLEQLKTVYGN